MANLVRVEAWKSADFNTITNSYTNLGSAFGHATRIVHFINNTDGDLAISFDGIKNNIPLPAGSFALYDSTSNQDGNESFRFQKGTQVRVKYLVQPTKGTVYIVCIYGEGE